MGRRFKSVAAGARKTRVSSASKWAALPTILALLAIAVFAVAAPAAQKHAGKHAGPVAHTAAQTNVYLTRGRWGVARDFFGPRHSNYENWQYTFDCGGITNSNCSHKVWEFRDTGFHTYDAYGTGKGWLGRSHAINGLTYPACRSESLSAQQPDRYCYQGYGS